MSISIRLSTLSKILALNTRTPIQNAEKAGFAPYFDGDFPEGGQHRYDGYHALTWVIAEMLRAQGCNMKMAGECARDHKIAINSFLDDVEQNQLPVTPRFVIAMYVAVEDSLAEAPQWQPVSLIGYGTAEEVDAAIVAAFRSVGKVTKTRNGRTEERVIGGPWIATAPIAEAYRLLCHRAMAAGYSVNGRSILKVTPETEADEIEPKGEV